MARNKFQSNNVRKKRRQRFVFKLGLSLLVLVLLVFALTKLLSISSLQVRNFTVLGAVSINEDDIKKTAVDVSGGKYFTLLPKTNFLIFPKKALEMKILNDFPRTQGVEVNLTSLQDAEINIKERKPFAIWCDSENPEKCYFMDSKGYVYAEGINATAGVYFIYRGGFEGSPMRQNYLPEFFVKLNLLIDEIKKMGVTPLSVEPINENEFEISAEGGKIIFPLEENTSRIISNLDSILQDQSLFAIRDGRLQVESIDLRYGNKAVIKRR